MKRIFLLTLLFIFLISPKVHSKDNDKPNIIFVLVDDMGYGDFGVLFQNQRAKKDDRSGVSIAQHSRFG